MADSQGLVSIVVSVYNIEEFLPRCLESISAQTYRNLEILLIDDGSTDDSGRLCDEFAEKDTRARVIHQENRGVWAVRNRGVEEANGEYVLFPDGDDYFHKDYVRLQYEAINLHGKEYPLAICDYRKVDSFDEDTWSDSEPVFEEIDQEMLLDRVTKYPSCSETLWGANWNKLYRKSALPMPFQREFYRCQDFDSVLRTAFLIPKAVYVRRVLYYWVQRPGQITRTADDRQIRDESRARIYLDNFLAIPDELSSWRPDLLLNLYRRLIIWKEDARGTEQFDAVSRKIRECEKQTVHDFLTCKDLTARRKVHYLVSLHAPSLLRFFKKGIRLERA